MFDSLAGYPHWFVVACTAVVACVAIWVILKLIKAALWMLLIGLLLAAAASAIWLFLR